MSTAPDSRSTILDPDANWWLDPALAKLAFGSRPRRAPGAAATGLPAHLAFLPPENLEIDLGDPQQCNFGDYQLLELIGQGGMGVVYRARQHSLDREVAVKLLSAGPWASVDFIARFQREAQSAARMQHPNIVPIHEIGSHEELNFFSMRLVTGGSLAHLIARRGKLVPREAARLLRAVAEAVDYAHRLDVLHLDLKPGNVLLDETGEPLVADFGLAKRLDESLSVDSNEVSGTPSYMAPEQAQVSAQSLTPATDIYGLGAILYESLTGRPPFAAPSPHETLRQVISDAPQALRTLDPTIPIDLEAICLKCLAKQPADRYRTARALSDDLNRFLEGREVRARPLRAGQRLLLLARREPRLTGLGALLFFSLVTGFAVSWVQWKRAQASADAAQSLGWEGRREAALQLERDGKGFEAFPKLLANIAEQKQAGKSEAVAVEQQRLGMLVGQGAQLIDRFAIADANPLSVAVSPDGKLVAVASNDQSIRWYDAGTMEARGRVSLVGRDTSQGERRPVLLLRFLDDARLLATLEWYENQVSPKESGSWLIRVDRAQVVEPPKAFANFASASFSPNGRFAVLRNLEQRSQAWSVDPWAPVSEISQQQDEDFPWFIDPRGRYALSLSTSMRRMSFMQLPSMAVHHTIDLPGNAGISALAMSSDGNLIAMGDFDGRIFVLDTISRSVRTLPSSRGRQITWVSFSEDDAWLATASNDGTLHAFDVATGDSLNSGQMTQDFRVQRVGISRQRRLLVAAGEGRTAVWRLPLPGPQAVPAVRLGLNPAPHGLTGRYPIAWSFATGLLASVGIDGQVRLWRLPPDPLLPAMAAPQIPERTFYDGTHVVDVAWDRVRVESSTGASSGPWLQLPQPAGFAELLAAGKLLVVTTGAQLRIYDAESLQPRFPPIALESSPERLVANADGSRLILCFGSMGGNGYQEHLRAYDARAGKRLPGEATLDGELRHLALSEDSSRLLAVGGVESATRVIAVDGMRQVGEFPHDPFQPVVWADFSASGTALAMVTRAQDTRLGADSLTLWDPATDSATTRELAALTRPVGVASSRFGVFVAGEGQDVIVAGNSDKVIESRLARSPSLAVVAVSPDGRVLAHAFQREIQLLDARSGAPLGTPLLGNSNAIDVIAQLAFAPDGQSLLARTMQGHWLSWRIAAGEASTHLAAVFPELAVERENQHVVKLPGAQARATLRGDDPGNWPTIAPRPRPRLAPAADAKFEIPARSGGDETQVDLSAFYNISPEAVKSSFYNLRPTMRPLPVGIQRLGGVDYDLRGMIQVGTPASQMQEGATSQLLPCVPLPPIAFQALHPLMTVSARSPIPSGFVVSTFTVRYMDGTFAEIPLRAGREVRGYTGEDAQVLVAFAGDRAFALFGMQDDVLLAPRLINPYPEKLARCVGIDAFRSSIPLLLLSLTLEPPSASHP